MKWLVRLSRPYPFKFFKGCLPQILLGLYLSTLSHISIDNFVWGNQWYLRNVWIFLTFKPRFSLKVLKIISHTITVIGLGSRMGKLITVNLLNLFFYTCFFTHIWWWNSNIWSFVIFKIYPKIITFEENIE